MADSYDVVVVGSGFGGAVVSARLAQAGRSVCLLERGRRWAPGEYPRSFSQVRRAVWDPPRAYGFLDYRVFSRIDVIQGAGVGGGSLHYFNVQLRAPERVFRAPSGLRRSPGACSIRTTTGSIPVVESAPLVPPAGEGMPSRTIAFQDAAGRSGFEPALVPIAVHTGPARANPVSGVPQEPCSFNADCLLGCRAHAKNNLDVTYIPMGERHGLELRQLHAVEHIRPHSNGGYTVVARQYDPDQPGREQRCELHAASLVLSAGALGSTELLLRARDVDRTLPRAADEPGRRFSSNGDMIFAGTIDADAEVDLSHGPSITVGAFVDALGITQPDHPAGPRLPSVAHLDSRRHPPGAGQAPIHGKGHWQLPRSVDRPGALPARGLLRGVAGPPLPALPRDGYRCRRRAVAPGPSRRVGT